MSDQEIEKDVISMFEDIESRPIPSNDILARAFDSIEDEWNAVMAKRRQNRRNRWYAVAATVVLSVVGATLTLNSPTSDFDPLLAHGEVQIGDSTEIIFSGSGSQVFVSEGDEVLSLSASRWMINSETDLRLAENTRVRWVSNSELELLQGAVYVATNGQSQFIVDTEYGRVVDVGTRYLVSTQVMSAEVAVREGRVQVESQHGTFMSDDLEKNRSSILVVDQLGVSETVEPKSSSRWEWIHDAPRGYQSNNPVVLLREIARDLGKEIEFQTIGLEASLELEVSDGDFSGMTPNEALFFLKEAHTITVQEEGDLMKVDFK